MVHLCDRIDQLFGIFPAKAWVGNGFSINMVADLLRAFFERLKNKKSIVRYFRILSAVKLLQTAGAKSMANGAFRVTHLLMIGQRKTIRH